MPLDRVDAYCRSSASQTEFVDGADLGQWRTALSRPANLVLLETPSNPMLEMVDLPAVAELAHAAGAIVVVDNVFATPLLQQPLKFGADVVVYSCTKHMDGQGRVLGGAVLASKKWINDVLQPFIRNTGPALSPFNAWVLLKGIETLACGSMPPAGPPRRSPISWRTSPRSPGSGIRRAPTIRSRRWHCKQMTAGGTVVTFEVAGGKDGAFRVMNGLQLIAVSNNLGDFEVAGHASGDHDAYAHRRAGTGRLGITDGVIRVSVGLEVWRTSRTICVRRLTGWPDRSRFGCPPLTLGRQAEAGDGWYSLSR